MKQPTKQALRNKIDNLEYGVDNFPPYAVTSLNFNEVNEAIKKKDDREVGSLMAHMLGDIEKHDLKVDYILVPNKIYKRFCNIIRSKKTFWGVKLIAIPGLKNFIFISNIESA